MKTARVLPSLLGALLLSAPALRAQEGDPRWLPWVGCWEATEADSRDMVCVRPSGAGIEVSEIADGTARSRQTLAADGRAYPITLEGCQGTRTAEFSSDGRRIFTINEQACDGDVSRTSTGLIAMVAPDEWIDVQAAQEDGRGLGWARRYRPASAQAVADAGFADLGDRAVAARGVPARHGVLVARPAPAAVADPAGQRGAGQRDAQLDAVGLRRLPAAAPLAEAVVADLGRPAGHARRARPAQVHPALLAEPVQRRSRGVALGAGGPRHLLVPVIRSSPSLSRAVVSSHPGRPERVTPGFWAAPRWPGPPARSGRQGGRRAGPAPGTCVPGRASAPAR